MSNEVILNLSFDNQTVTDLTGKWALEGTPNATYEQIDGRDGYSIVTGSLGRCIVLNAVDQNAVYNEYTVDFDMFVKSTYTSDYYFYDIVYLWSSINSGNEYSGEIGDVLDVCLKIGGSERTGTTNYSPIGRWVHVTFTSGPTEVTDQYCTTVYVDGVKLIDRTDIDTDNPFALSQQIMLLTRDMDAKLMPNGPGICLNTFKVVTGIHMPDQNPAISLFNLSRVFNNFCTWLKGQLSTVALTGSYNDLSNKPTISTVNNATLTIQQNGTNVQTFTANASTNKTANIQCVDLSSNQTIAGNKTFSGRGTFSADCIAYNPDSSGMTSGVKLRNSKAEVLSTGNTASDQYITFRDKNDFNFGYIRGAVQSNGVAIKIGANAKDSSDTTINAELQLLAYSNGNKAIFPTTTDTYDLGRSAAQWNNAYIKSLIINGVACGDILTHNASEFVDLSSNQTIGGNKIFSGSFTVNKPSPRLQMKSTTYSSETSSGMTIGEIAFLNNSGAFSAWIVNQLRDDLTTRLCFRVFPQGSGGYKGFVFDDTCNLYPENSQSALGTTTNKWKDVNTVLLNGKTPAYNDDVIPRSGGAVLAGQQYQRTVDDSSLYFYGGTDWQHGGMIAMYGQNSTDGAGIVRLIPSTSSGYRIMTVAPDGTWTWQGQAVQLVSDQRLKQQITEIDDKLLDAWQDVELCQFKYNDAVDQKKDKARLHTGYVVQQIDSACKSHNVDISEYGLYCHEEYLEETEEVEVEQEDGTKTKEKKVIREASEHYSLRYTEALIVECAYLRKCIKELRNEIEQLKK